MRSLWIANAVAVDATPEEIAWLSKQPDVEAITENVILSVPRVEVHAIDSQTIKDKLWNLSAIGADALKAVANGSGVRIGVLDTGINASLPDLAGKVLAWSEFDSYGNRVESLPHETHSQGHGTHVASVIVGETTGIAPGAGLLSALVLPGGAGSIEQVLAGLQWVVDPDGDPDTDDGAQIVNMSWGKPGVATALWQAVDNLAACGILPIAAIGNGGDGYTSSPANDPKSVGVGAINSDDAVSTFSGGENVCQGGYCFLKPDITAPGEDIPGLDGYGSYQLMSGTSLAVPHVCGIAALLLEANPRLTLPELSAFLVHGTLDLDGQLPRQDIRYGWGRLDGQRSMDFLESYASRMGSPDLVIELDDSASQTYFSHYSDGKLPGPNGEADAFTAPAASVDETVETCGLGDVDGDGYADLVTVHSKPAPGGYLVSYKVRLNFNASGFSNEEKTWYEVSSTTRSPYKFIALCDVDGDRKKDLVLDRETTDKSGTYSHVFALKSNGTAFQLASTDDWALIYTSCYQRLTLSVGDVNGDGKADLVYGSSYYFMYAGYPTYYYVALSTGKRFNTSALWGFTYPTRSGDAFNFVAISDVNADGLADIVVTKQEQRAGSWVTSVYVCLSNGSYMFIPQKIWAELPGGPEDLKIETVRDTNGDGAGDLIAWRYNLDSGKCAIEIDQANPSRQVFVKGEQPSISYTHSLASNGFRVLGVEDVGIGDWR